MSRARAAVVAGVVVATLTAGYVALDAADVVPGPLTAAAPHPEPTPPIETAPPGPRPEPPLRTLSSDAPAPDGEAVAQTLTPLFAASALGDAVGIDVRDGRTGAPVWSSEASVPRTPASATKLLTAAAVASTTDLDRTFATRTVRGAAPDHVVLVAGGDTLLSPQHGDPESVPGRAGIADLAEATAASLREQGTTSVRVYLDDTYAAGPALAPAWAPVDVALGLTAPVAMLGTTDTRAWPYDPAPPDPALTTTSAFAAALVEEGIRVRGRPERADAPPEAVELGVVQSAPVVDVLAEALQQSDNALTESLARSALAQAEPTSALTFEATSAWVRDQLTAAGIDTSEVVLVDTSGLSRGTRVPTSVVADVVTRGATGEDDDLAGVVARLPVAGLSGTLHDRFLGPRARAAAGRVRAKTGTLTGVHALAGTLVDADGALLTYAVLADDAGGTLEARAALDDLVAALAACGCR